MISGSTVLSRADRVEFRSLGEGEGGVLLKLDDGAYHGLNETGTLIWRLLDEVTLERLLVLLREELEGVPDTFDEEIRRFLQQLHDRGLVAASSGGSSGAGRAIAMLHHHG